MNFNIKKISSAVAVLLAIGVSSQAIAASSITLGVTGKISPPSCDVSLSGGDALDFGLLISTQLNATAPTKLEPKTTSLIVSCNTKTAFALRSRDIAPGASALPAEITNIYKHPFSLGQTSRGKSIGGYQIVSDLTSAQYDGAPPSSTMYSYDNGKTWKKDTVSSQYWFPTGLELFAVGDSSTDTTAVIPVKDATIPLQISPVIVPLNDIGGSADDINFAGNATFDVVYL